MTALLLLALLVAGGWAYVQWAVHSIAHGVPVWWFVIAAPVVYFAPAAVLVAIWLLVAWVWRTPRPPDARLGPGGTLRLYLTEVLSLGLSWPLMALHRLLIRDPPPAPAKRPVVLIHGVLVNDGVWFVLRRFLMRRGGAPVYTINYGPPFADIERFAKQLAARIEGICTATGAEHVVLVAHSMGGLVARAYLRRFGPGRVARVITIGTPHHGSILAYSFPGRGLSQMHPGNPWLAELNRGESKPPPVPMTSIWSRHDSMVMPQASSVFAGAENIAVIGVAHNALVRDQGVMELVAREIEAAPPALTGQPNRSPSSVTTFLFTDIEGSTRLWEQEPERMQAALARHDAIARAAVERNRGEVVKTSGDGIHAAFADPLDAVCAAVQLQQALADPEATGGIALRVRCGMHAGVHERRDRDFFGTAVNRAARIMSAAHGGQVLVSQVVAALAGERLPPGVTLRDLGSVRLRDLSNPERVYQVAHPQLRQDFPALRSLEATPNNLPQQVTSFIGRERELAELKTLLASTRLLTLIGVGGIGKTRLSLQAAADLMDDYPDGVWFVEVAPLADARLVPQAVASVLGVKEEAGRPVAEALVKYVKDKRLLIIFDNCEHLLGACAELAKQLVQAGPDLRILASSREHLHIAGEATYAVPALATPDPYEKFIHTALTQYEAARLFIDRAVAAQPTFALSEQNAAAIAEVCHRLDGIPLAIELAASRTRALPVETIASRLSDRFRLLTGGDRTALPRQQTLRALIDWSYDLLTERERALFRRLAVFAGGWTLEAAEAIGANGDIDETDVLDLLTDLVGKSLVAVEAEGGRYRLLETIRQYAQERLDASGEVERIRTRHLAFYLAFAEKARPELVGPRQAAWLARLDLEHENLLAAHAWCDRAASGGEAGLRLVDAVKPYWFIRGLLGLRHRLTVDALMRPTAQERNLSRCRGLFNAGQVCCFMGRYKEAQGHLRESLAIARELDNAERVVAVLQLLGMSSLGQGDTATARMYLEEALSSARELGNKVELAAALNALAQLHRVQGELDAAEPLYAECLALTREVGDREYIAVSLLNLAMVAIGRGERDRARRMLLDVLELVGETGSKPAGQSVLEVSAGLASMSEEWERAARLFGMAEAQAELTGLHRDPADDAFLVPLIARARVTLGATAFAAAETAGRALSYSEAVREARGWLGGDSPSEASRR